LRPIAEISRAAQEIAAGDLANRINATETESELGQLATVLNSTFARLDAAFAQQKQFTSDAAHELRTPVSVILTQTQSTLNKERSAAEYRETLEACQRAAQRMKRLIESLLQLARLDAGQENLKREALDLAHIASDCIELVRPLAEARRMTLHTDFQRAACRGDGDRLALVVTNLLTNAIHYGSEGGAVRIATRNGKDSVMLSVADNGPGIATEHLPHLFERFYRADAARTSAQGRNGLGLAISKGIVEAHGGALEVSSAPGEGATFTMRLPAT
jgi:heavy metal sensor kinase